MGQAAGLCERMNPLVLCTLGHGGTLQISNLSHQLSIQEFEYLFTQTSNAEWLISRLN